MLQRASMLPRLTDSALAKTQAWIDGAWADGSQGKFPVTNPADGGRLAEVANCGPADALRAIDAANRASPAWRTKTARERGVILRRWNDLMLHAQDDLARLMTAEQGKPLAESRGE